MPWDVIQQKFNGLRPNQVLEFEDGHYTGQWRLNPYGQKVGDPPVIIRGGPGAVIHDGSGDEFGAIYVTPKYHNVRFEKLNITGKDGFSPVSLFTVGGYSDVTVLEHQPCNVVLVECRIWGNPKYGGRRGLTFNAGKGGVVRRCRITDICKDEDSQAIHSGNGGGGWIIEDNWLSSTGECFMLGGSLGSIKGHTIEDVLVQRNRIFKNPAWRTPQWSVKNLIELKRGVNIRILNNLLEDNWAGTHNGFAMVFTIRTERDRCPWNRLEKIVVEGNVIRRVGGFMNILGIDYNGDADHNSNTANDFTVRNNFCIIERGRGEPCGVRVMTGAENLTFDTNTVVASDGLPLKFGLFVNAPSPKGQPPTIANVFMHVKGLKMKKNILSGPCAGDGVGFGQGPLNLYTRDSDVTDNLWVGTGAPSGNTAVGKDVYAPGTYISNRLGYGAVGPLPKLEGYAFENEL